MRLPDIDEISYIRVSIDNIPYCPFCKSKSLWVIASKTFRCFDCGAILKAFSHSPIKKYVDKEQK